MMETKEAPHKLGKLAIKYDETRAWTNTDLQTILN